MPPQRLHYDVLHVLELVGLSARLAGVRHFRWRGVDYRGSSLGGRRDHRHRGQRRGDCGSAEAGSGGVSLVITEFLFLLLTPSSTHASHLRTWASALCWKRSRNLFDSGLVSSQTPAHKVHNMDSRRSMKNYVTASFNGATEIKTFPL